MANAKRDDNFVSTALGVSNVDGKTAVPFGVNPTTHSLTSNNGTTGSDNGPTNAVHDDNRVPTLLAVSSVDGVTPVVIYSDTQGRILINSH